MKYLILVLSSLGMGVLGFCIHFVFPCYTSNRELFMTILFFLFLGLMIGFSVL